MTRQRTQLKRPPGEYFLSSQDINDPRLVRVVMVGDYSLYQRHEDVTLAPN